uniref:Uncharacterized protein n=1 Tax=Pongo abelii TaxID=9601 RepID=A0A8I5T3N5_PONAB
MSSWSLGGMQKTGLASDSQSGLHPTLPAPQFLEAGGQKKDIGYFDNLKANSRNITNSMTFLTKSSNQNFMIFLNKVQATITEYKGRDFLAILDPLDPDTLPNGRIWLFGFNSYFFQHNSFCMRSTSKRVGLQGCAQMGFLVLFVMPLLISSVTTEPPSSTKSMTLAQTASAMGLSKREKQLSQVK